MKFRYISIVLVLLVVAALSVSGCTMLGGNNNGGGQTATPTATPGTTEPGATATPVTAPTNTPGASVGDKLASLYNLGQLHWFEYRLTTDIDGENMISTFKMEMLGQGVDPKDGKMKEHTRMTSTMNIPGMGPQTNTMDFYNDPNEPTTDSETSPSSYMTSEAALVNQGSDVVVIDGKTYACTKYSVTEDGSTTTFWHSPQAPLPVKYTSTSEGTTMTTELLGWG